MALEVEGIVDGGRSGGRVSSSCFFQRLAAGGRWIRTFGSPTDQFCSRDSDARGSACQCPRPRAFRRKVRRDRRYGLRLERPFVFYPRYTAEIALKAWRYWA